MNFQNNELNFQWHEYNNENLQLPNKSAFTWRLRIAFELLNTPRILFHIFKRTNWFYLLVHFILLYLPRFGRKSLFCSHLSAEYTAKTRNIITNIIFYKLSLIKFSRTYSLTPTSLQKPKLGNSKLASETSSLASWVSGVYFEIFIEMYALVIFSVPFCIF